MGSIEQARQEVQTAFAKAVEVTDKGQMQPLAAMETSLWSLLLALGRALIALYLARQGARPRPAHYEHERMEYEVVGTADSEVGTRFGKVSFRRAVGRAEGAPRAARDLPVDRELGCAADSACRY